MCGGEKGRDPQYLKQNLDPLESDPLSLWRKWFLFLYIKQKENVICLYNCFWLKDLQVNCC